MTEFQVDLSAARFEFDMDLLEHVVTEIPVKGSGTSLVFDHQKTEAREGDRLLFQYNQVQSCAWDQDRKILECRGNGVAFRFTDPNMGTSEAKELFFRLANICNFNPQVGLPEAAVQQQAAPEAPPFNPAVEFRLPRETLMVGFVPAADHTKPDDITVQHFDKKLLIRLHEKENQILIDGQPWARLDDFKEFFFRRQEQGVEFVMNQGRWLLFIGADRPAQIFENRVKAWARSRKLGLGEAIPQQYRKITHIPVQLGRAVVEGGQVRIPGNRDVLFHHGQELIRLDGEVFGPYSDISQIRTRTINDRLFVRFWMQPNTLFILEDVTPAGDRNAGRAPEVLRALSQNIGVGVEIG